MAPWTKVLHVQAQRPEFKSAAHAHKKLSMVLRDRDRISAACGWKPSSRFDDRPIPS